MTGKNKLNIKIILFFLVFIISLIFFGGFALAADECQPGELCDPLGLQEEGLLGIWVRIARLMIGFTGVLAFVIFVYGGFTWITSGGNPERVKKGQQMLIWAIVGIAVVFSSYIILRLVIQAITGATMAQ